jgi:hypothetical protein
MNAIGVILLSESMLGVILLHVVIQECYYAPDRFTRWRFAECHYAQCRCPDLPACKIFKLLRNSGQASLAIFKTQKCFVSAFIRRQNSSQLSILHLSGLVASVTK